MKRRKWLFVVVAVLIAVGAAFTLAVRSGWADEFIRERIERQLAEAIQAEVHLGQLSANDRSAYIFDTSIQLKDDLGALYVRRLYVRYNLWRYLFSGFQFDGVIEHVSIEEPELHLRLKPATADTTTTKAFELPDLAGFFDSIELKDGSVHIVAGDSLAGIAQTIRDIQLDVNNRQQTQGVLRARLGEARLEGSATLEGGELLLAEVKLLGWHPHAVHLPVLDSLDLRLDVSVQLHGDTLSYTGRIDSLHVDAAGRTVRGGITFKGGLERLRVDSESLLIDGQLVRLATTLRQPFDAERPLDGNLRGVIDIDRYTTQAGGKVRVDVELGGTVGHPRIRAQISSDSLVASGEALRDIRARVNWQPGSADFELRQANWRGNALYGRGDWRPREGLQAWIDCDTLRFTAGGWSVAGYTRARVELQGSSIRGEAEVFDMSVRGGPVALNGLGVRARYGRNRLRLELQDPERRMQLTLRASPVDSTATVSVDFRRFPLAEILPGVARSLPSLSGGLELTASPRNVQLTSGLRVFDSRYGQLDGFFKTSAAIDFVHDRSFLSFTTEHGVYNYEPFSLNLLADGAIDSISTRNFTINDEIDIDMWVKLAPKFDIGLRLRAPRVRIPRYLAYVMGSYAARQYGGSLDLELAYNRRGGRRISARARTEGLHVAGLKNLAIDLSLSGTPKRLLLARSRLLSDDRIICDLGGSVNLTNGEYRINAINDSLNLAHVFPGQKLQGKLRFQCTAFKHTVAGQGLDVRLNGLDCNFYGIEADTLEVELTQREELLSVHRLYSHSRAQYTLEADGAIAYNVLTNKAYSDSVSLSLRFLGDPFRMLSNASPVFENGRGFAKLDLDLSVRDEHLSVEHGSIEVTKGRIEIVGQVERIDKISVAMNIEQNVLSIQRARFRMGEGRIYLSNDHENAEESLFLGRLNLGAFNVRTNSKGLLVHVPQFTPEGSVVKAIITGRDGDAMRITGPFDQLEIVGDVFLSNGEAIFPPNTKNLMDFVTGKPSGPKEGEVVNLPLRFDIIIHVTEHMRYVTRPADFLLNPDSFLHLVYDGEQFLVPEAVFTSERGTAEVFGTMFHVDFLQIQISQFNPTPRIVGSLFRKTADGTLITLKVLPGGEDAPGTWVIELESDDPADQSMMDILAKLRYNRSRDELSPQQQQSLLQDEALDMAGVEIENVLFDPLISPLENRVRHLLRLDSFTMRPSVVRNLFNEYTGSDDPAAHEIDGGDAELLQTGAGLLLNNLSINCGKYVVRNVYIDYELLVQETTDIETMDLKLNHTMSLRYDLPWRLQLSYKYIIDTEAEETNHEIWLERGFRF
ncbi:MAG: hypothetical protein K8R90_00140 [Candidatus Cloacimonetes bacterium]|nr:hypothetical protein [Candidatus Cloacimonadota bacterium]